MSLKHQFFSQRSLVTTTKEDDAKMNRSKNVGLREHRSSKNS